GGGDGLRDNEYTRSAELFLTQAEAMGAGARFQDALNAALNSIAEDPTNPVGYFQAARAQVGLWDYEAADTLLRIALEMHPGYEADVELVRDGAWRSAFNSATDPMDAGNMQQAIELWESAEVIYPGRYPQALMNLGSSYPDVGRVDDAIDAYATALEVIRDPSTAEMMMSDSAVADEWVDYERTVVNNRAVLLVQQERFTEAAADLAAYLETHPDDLDALANRAAVLVEAGMPDSAQAIYDNLLSDASLGAGDYFNIGVGLYNTDNLQRAAEAFGRVLEISPQHREAVFLQAYSLNLAEDFEACVPVAMKLIDLDQYHLDNYRILARCLAGTDQGQEAARYLQEMQNLDFSVLNPTLFPQPGGGGTVTAEFTNKSLETGTMVTVRVHFNGSDGATVGTASLRVEAPAPGETTTFQADLTSDQEVVGYYFQIIPPR
ncbi:MAG: tetratricopeptide repeat protein, partial [Gemmatimonadetes bacterium]|nr:tetratricopeptide repeat protein [Gemmatimonadota bacterium]MYH51700.1 tetratricopeptide repeat protein [Gemmatimonadota bacterium]MYK67588.1 tetratricopeptide repeat protein [Gemmatimonadota bacterium]